MKSFALLTSSRADFGIYKSLITRMESHSSIALELIVFGTHLMSDYGATLDEVTGSAKNLTIIEIPYEGDSAERTSEYMGNTISRFAEIWRQRATRTEAIICLGDRFEMYASVVSSVPFDIPVIHIHGGETSEGAMDDIFRNSLTTIASTHFVTHEAHAKRVSEIKGNWDGVHVIGSLSLDDLEDFELYSVEEFRAVHGIDLHRPTILMTYHPVTKNGPSPERESEIIGRVLRAITGMQILITMPNMDPGNSMLRKTILEAANENDEVHVRESLGKKGYFTALRNCKALVGNSSSALIESASFGIHALDIGTRQKGRMRNMNVHHCDLQVEDILESIGRILKIGAYTGDNLFRRQDGAANEALAILAAL